MVVMCGGVCILCVVVRMWYGVCGVWCEWCVWMWMWVGWGTQRYAAAALIPPQPTHQPILSAPTTVDCGPKPETSRKRMGRKGRKINMTM